MNTVYQVRGLRAGYRRQAVLSDVSLSIGEGELWCFLGPNGHGKTTLLHTIMGVLRPLGGQLTVDRNLAGARHRAYVPQRNRMQDTLPVTVREFVETGLVGLGRLPAAERLERIHGSLEALGILDLARASFHALSGGQAQRAVLARALARRPRTLLVDEPTNNLDPTTEQAVQELLRRQQRDEHATVIVVTHSLPVARLLATHVALVHDGQVQSGTAKEMFQPDVLAGAMGGHLP